MNKEKLLKELNKARLTKNNIAIEALKSSISEIDLKSSSKDLSEEDVINIIKKEYKKFIDASEAFKKDNAEKGSFYLNCAEYLNSYLPKQINESDYQKILNELTENGLNFGQIMKSAKEKYGNSLDMSKFSKFVKNNT